MTKKKLKVKKPAKVKDLPDRPLSESELHGVAAGTMSPRHVWDEYERGLQSNKP